MQTADDLDKHELIEEATLPKSSLSRAISQRLQANADPEADSLVAVAHKNAAKAEEAVEAVGHRIKAFLGRLPYMQVCAPDMFNMHESYCPLFQQELPSFCSFHSFHYVTAMP